MGIEDPILVEVVWEGPWADESVSPLFREFGRLVVGEHRAVVYPYFYCCSGFLWYRSLAHRWREDLVVILRVTSLVLLFPIRYLFWVFLACRGAL